MGTRPGKDFLHCGVEFETKALSECMGHSNEVYYLGNHLFLVAGQTLFCAHEGGWVAQPMAGAHHCCSMTAKEAMTSS